LKNGRKTEREGGRGGHDIPSCPVTSLHWGQEVQELLGRPGKHGVTSERCLGLIAIHLDKPE